MSRAARWFERRERGSTWGMRLTVWLYRYFGRGVARLLMGPIVAYFFLTDRAGRAGSLAYLRRIASRPGGAAVLPCRPGTRLVFLHYLEFGRAILDRLAMWLGERRDFEIVVHGEEHLRRVEREGRGAVFLGAHLGSFEAMRMVADDQSPIAVNLLMFTRHAARINDVFRRLEEASEKRSVVVRVIEIQPGSFAHVLEARECVERGEVVAILADRVPPGETRRVARPEFLGDPIPIPVGPFQLAHLLGCPVLFMTALRRSDRSYDVFVEWIADRLELPRHGRDEALAAHCQSFADRLASRCIQAPLQWFNFYDPWSQDAPGADL